MKRTLALCLAFATALLPLTGLAQGMRNTLPEVREQAAGGWRQTYEAHGRSIQVDIPVQVPEAASFPVLKAIPMPALDTLPLTDWQGHNQERHKLFNETGFFRWDTPAREIKAQAAQKNLKEPPRGMDVKPMILRFNQLEWDTPYSYNNPFTLRDAAGLMADKWTEYAPGEPIFLMPHWIYARGEMRAYDRKSDTFSGDPWPYFQAPLIVYLNQLIRGIPLLCYASESFAAYTGLALKKETRNHVGGIAIMQGLQDIGLEEYFYSAQYALMKEDEELAADVPLCSFHKAVAAYEQLILEGKLRKVDSLRLGYVLWRDKGKAESYTLLPTWVLEGELFPDAKAGYQVPMTQASSMPLEYGPILVNAQTGELINPWNTSPNRFSDVPKIIGWE